MRNPLDLWRNTSLLQDWNQMQRSLDRNFGDLPGATWNPTCEVKESKNAYEFRFDLPGVPKDGIKIELHDNTLTVSGERRDERKEDDKDKKRHLSEVFYGTFMRSFTLPAPVDNERVEAKYDNGVLGISIPKLEVSRARQITIK